MAGRRIDRNKTLFATASLLLVLWLAGSAEADQHQAADPVVRPIISERDVPVEAFTPVASDGRRGIGYLRKPPGKGPFPAVVLIHGGLPGRPAEVIREYTLSTHPSRFLEAGYVVAVITHRGRASDPTAQTAATVSDCVAAVEHVKALAFVDPKSVVVSGTSGGGDLSLEIATRTEVAAIVPEEPASVLMAGLVVADSKVARAADYIKLYEAERDHSMFRAKIAAITSPILIIQGTHSTHSGINQFNVAVLIPELRAAGKHVQVITFPGEPHTFSFASNPEKTPRPAAALKAFRDIDAFLKRHIETQPLSLAPGLVRHVPIPGQDAPQSASPD